MSVSETCNHSHDRILMIDLAKRLGGASMRTLNLLQAMQPGQASLATLHHSPVHEQARQMGLEVYSVGHSKADIAIIRNLLKLVKSKGFTVFDTQNPQSKFWGTIAGRLAGVRIVSTLNSWYLNEHQGRWRGWLYHMLERASSPWTDMYIAVSADILKNLQGWHIDDNRLSLIPNAVSLSLNYVHRDRTWLKEQFNLPDNVVVCVATGRLVPAKGYDHLINTMALLDNNIVCLIIGDGQLRPELTAQIQQQGLEQRIKLVGFKRQEVLLGMVELADIYVMSSLTEGTPVSLLEAAALSRPIVSTNAGGIPEMLHNREHALLVTPGNDQELAEAIAWLSKHKAEAEQMALAANAHISKHFSLQAQVSLTLETYESILQKK